MKFPIEKYPNIMSESGVTLLVALDSYFLDNFYQDRGVFLSHALPAIDV